MFKFNKMMGCNMKQINLCKIKRKNKNKKGKNRKNIIVG